MTFTFLVCEICVQRICRHEVYDERVCDSPKNKHEKANGIESHIGLPCICTYVCVCACIYFMCICIYVRTYEKANGI